MQHAEFVMEFRKLCEGFSYRPSPQQMEAFFERLRHVQYPDFREAVTSLLCAPRFPQGIEPILQACDVAQAWRRKLAVQQERAQAETWGKASSRTSSASMDARYAAFRIGLLAGRGDTRGIIERHAFGLAEWFMDADNAAWAMTQPMSAECGFHKTVHTLFDCLKDEVAYWDLRHNGFCERHAQVRVVGVERKESPVCRGCAAVKLVTVHD
jgi:hypothetical protein